MPNTNQQKLQDVYKQIDAKSELSAKEKQAIKQELLAFESKDIDQKIEYLTKPNKEIEKGIASLDKQIKLHENKIKNPAEHNHGWQDFHPNRKESLFKRWQGDIKRQAEQKNILENILKNRKE